MTSSVQSHYFYLPTKVNPIKGWISFSFFVLLFIIIFFILVLALYMLIKILVPCKWDDKHKCEREEIQVSISSTIYERLFLYEIDLCSFSSVTFWLCNFLDYNFGTKAACKMIVKLKTWGEIKSSEYYES